jgi:hypothetical protein
MGAQFYRHCCTNVRHFWARVTAQYIYEGLTRDICRHLNETRSRVRYVCMEQLHDRTHPSLS